MKVLECEKLNNPPVSEYGDIGDDDTWNVWLDNMVDKQWYSFKLDNETTIYLMRDKNHLIQTTQLPKLVTKVRGEK